jgi:hypothetical protein|eukprot:COSAG02_NODE_5582_length_4214_cov_17.001215_2_plen_74_part_00
MLDEANALVQARNAKRRKHLVEYQCLGAIDPSNCNVTLFSKHKNRENTAPGVGLTQLHAARGDRRHHHPPREA